MVGDFRVIFWDGNLPGWCRPGRTAGSSCPQNQRAFGSTGPTRPDSVSHPLKRVQCHR